MWDRYGGMWSDHVESYGGTVRPPAFYSQLYGECLERNSES